MVREPRRGAEGDLADDMRRLSGPELYASFSSQSWSPQGWPSHALTCVPEVVELSSWTFTFACMSISRATNGKARQYTQQHADACVRAKKEMHPIADREIVELIEQNRELFGVKFHKTPTRSQVNNWVRDGRVRQIIEEGGKITPQMLKGRGTAILWAVLDRAESLAQTKPAEAAEAVAVVARAAKHLEVANRVPQRPNPQKTNGDSGKQDEQRSATLDRLRQIANETGDEGRVPSSVEAEDVARTQDQGQA